MNKLKPVIYTTHTFKKGAPERTQQVLLLKAMQVTQDPKKLKEMMGFRTVAEVYRTLDKMAMRKEYHEALVRAGVDLDFVVTGIRDIAMAAEKDGDRLKAMQLFLKSLGLDKYDTTEAGGGTWEEELMKLTERDKQTRRSISGPVTQAAEEVGEGLYEVQQPVIPESIKKTREEEAELTKGIYD